MINLKKSELKLVEHIEKKVRDMKDDNPFGYVDGIDTLAQSLEENTQFHVKDYKAVINYFMDKELHIYKTEKDKKEVEIKAVVYDMCKQVIEKALKYRRERNKKTSKVETNLLTHAPYFVGGSRKRKKKGREEGYILIEKSGVRKITYENDLGIMLTMADAKTLFALFSLWEEQNFSEWITFTEYKLLNKMNLKDGGEQYKNIRNSLEKLRNTSVIMKEAYDREEGKRQVTNRFKLIIADKFTEDFNYKGEIKSKTYEIQFSPYINTSLKSGYYSLISLTIFNDLELETAQGIYLMFVGINNMDRNEKYFNRQQNFEIPLEEVYESLFIESEKHKRKGVVERGCEELKDVGVLDDFYFKNLKKKNESVVLVLSEWQRGVLNKKEQLGDLETKLVEDI